MEVQALWSRVIVNKYGIIEEVWKTRDIVLSFRYGMEEYLGLKDEFRSMFKISCQRDRTIQQTSGHKVERIFGI